MPARAAAAQSDLTTSEVATRLHVTVRWVHELVARGALSPYRLGRALRFRAEDVAAFRARPASPYRPAQLPRGRST